MVSTFVFHYSSEVLEVPFFYQENLFLYFVFNRDYLLHCYNHPSKELLCVKADFPEEQKLPRANVSCFDNFSYLHETTVKSGSINNGEGSYYFEFNKN